MAPLERLAMPVESRPWPAPVEDLADRLGIAPIRMVATSLALVVLAGIGWLVYGGESEPLPELTIPQVTVVPTTAIAEPGSPAQGARDSPIVVHAAGAVVHPGVYELAPGERVADLVARAGGLRSDADLARLNLAGLLADGQRLYVPVTDEVVPAPVVPQGSIAAVGGRAGGAVSINEADATTLEQLPGVGPAIAGAIVEYRTANGPFVSVEELLGVSGIGEAKLSALRGRITP